MIRAIFGGTFDPIHNGHIKTASALVNELDIPNLALMPSAIPPHRPQPGASAGQRFDMVRLAAQQHPSFQAEDWELTQDRPSYTAKTLSDFKTRHPQDTLVFVMGMDSLMSLHRWYQWEQLIEYAHLVVMPRAGVAYAPTDEALIRFIASHKATTKCALRAQTSGLLYLADTPMIDVSATDLRHRLRTRERDLPIPDSVYDYIKHHQLYL